MKTSLSEPFRYSGYWRLPDQDQWDIAGTVEYDPHSGVRLTLMGEIDPTGLGEGQEFISGITADGRKITLIGCYVSSTKLTSGGITQPQYECQFALVGNYWPDLTDPVFKVSRFAFDRLDAWLNSKPISISKPSKRAGLNVKVKMNKRVRLRVADQFVMAVLGGYSYERSGGRIAIETGSLIELSIKKGERLQWHLDRAFEFLDFATLCLGAPIRMTTFEFRRGKLKLGPSTSIDETASLYFYDRRGTGIESTSGYPIVPFAKVTETILSNWSAIRKQFEPVVDLLMTVMYSSQLHSETRFLLAIQGIEAFDRISRPEHLVPSDDYKKITSLMLTAIPPNTPKIVRDKLKTTLLYANEPSLRQRLKRLHDELTVEFGEMPLRMKRNDVNRLVDTRNYLTHYPEELKASAVPANELAATAHQLTLLTIVLILRRLGFSADSIQRALHFNSNFRMFAPPNPALAKN